MANIQQGTFTSAGSSVMVDLADASPTYFEIFNYTNAASTANPGVVKRAWWQQGMANASYVGIKNTAGAATDETVTATSNGFTPIDLANPPTFAASTISSINQNATPTVTTSAPHGLVVGDLVRLNSTTSMEQVGQIVYSVVTVPLSTTFTINIDTSGFAAAATGGSATKILRGLYVPKELNVTGISQANGATVNFSRAHGYAVGDKLRFTIPSAYGMIQLNGLLCTITSISTYSVVIDTDTSGFTAFAYPTSANSLINSKAICVPVGVVQTQSNVIDATRNTGFKGMLIGSAVCGAASDVLYWKAEFADSNITTTVS
jgi:hypothetical protein